MKHMTAPLWLLLLCACAARPADIAPAMVSSTLYKDMTCKNLERELEKQYADLSTLSQLQREDRSLDIALNTILMPGLGALTRDQEEEIAESKGHLIVIREQIAERCGTDSEDGGDSQESPGQPEPHKDSHA